MADADPARAETGVRALRARRRAAGRWIALILVPGLAAAGWWVFARPPAGADRFQTVEVATGDLEEVITANGTLSPVGVVNVGVQVSGTVQAIHADFNDRVAAGQLLLELDPRLFQARLRQSEANLARQKAQAELAEANRRRAEELMKREFISGQAYDQAKAAAATAAAEVKAAEAAVAQDRANLAFSVVRAPVSGVIISRQVDVGQTVAASFQTPTLFTIARDLTRMQIEAAVAESDIGRVKVGQPVTFSVDAFPARRFTGTVAQVRLNPTIQQNVVTFTVVITVDNPDGVLLPGMTATVRFAVAENRGVLLVPNAALAFRPEGFDPRTLREAARGRAGPADGRDRTGFPATVFVPGPDGRPEPRLIRIGASDDDRSIVLSGPLAAGERVIIADRRAKRRESPSRFGGAG
ncbi:efflux RND transporter periplasmic adaptor subunit [Thermaurantiacus sp.]